MTSLKSIFLLLRSKVQDSYVGNPQDKKHSNFQYWSRKSKHCWKRGLRARDYGFGWPGLDKDYKSAWLMPELLGVEGEFQILLRPIRINYISVPNRDGYVRTKENDPKKQPLAEIITFITRSRNLGEPALSWRSLRQSCRSLISELK